MEVAEVSDQITKAAAPEKKSKSNDHGIETRKIQVPKHRMVPLKENWLKIFNPVVEHLKLQIRFNLKTKKVEIRTSKDTQDISNLQKGMLSFVWPCFSMKGFSNLLFIVIYTSIMQRMIIFFQLPILFRPLFSVLKLMMHWQCLD